MLLQALVRDSRDAANIEKLQPTPHNVFSVGKEAMNNMFNLALFRPNKISVGKFLAILTCVH